MKLVSKEEVLKILNKEYCECGSDHGENDHAGNPEEVWCIHPDCKDKSGYCTEKINWPIARAVSEIYHLPTVQKVIGIVKFSK